jgi:hypothetical protein
MRHFSFLPLIIFFSLLGLSAQQITFRDITAQAGIHFTHNNAAFGTKYLPETMGPSSTTTTMAGLTFFSSTAKVGPDIPVRNPLRSSITTITTALLPT